MKTTIGTIIVPIESYLIQKGCPIPFRIMFYKKIAIIKYCNMSTYATTLSRMAGWTPSKNEGCFSLSISSCWSIFVFTFFKVIMSIPIWKMCSAFTVKTHVCDLVCSLHIKNSPTSYSCCFSFQLLNLTWWSLQVVFNYAMLYVDDIVSSVHSIISISKVFLNQFSCSFTTL